jgi:predicted nucleotidyltransferase
VTKTYTIDKIRELAVPIAQKYGVGKLALFGSYARGEQKPESDIDFLIDRGEILGLFKFCGFIDDLEQTLETHVDVLTYDSMKNSLIADAINDEVILYERA